MRANEAAMPLAEGLAAEAKRKSEVATLAPRLSKCSEKVDKMRVDLAFMIYRMRSSASGECEKGWFF